MTYYIGVSGDVFPGPATYTHLTPDCPLVWSILDGGAAVDTNVIKDFDSTDGSFKVGTSDMATYDL